jgi:hypothetical protein
MCLKRGKSPNFETVARITMRSMSRHRWAQTIETLLEIELFNLKQEYFMNTLQKTAIAAAISGLFAPAAFAQAARLLLESESSYG